MGTVNVYRVRAVLDAPKKDQDLLAFANRVDQKMTNNPNFTSPTSSARASGTCRTSTR
jgi:hypothetical protein